MLQMTRHGACRAQQRSVPPAVLDWLIQFGEEEFLGEGVLLIIGQFFIELGEFSEAIQLIIIDVVTVFLGKQIFIHPIIPAFGEDNGSVSVFVQAFFEHSAAC